MRNLIYILSMMLLALLASCSDDERLLPGKEENGSRMRSITFSTKARTSLSAHEAMTRTVFPSMTRILKGSMLYICTFLEKSKTVIRNISLTAWKK